MLATSDTDLAERLAQLLADARARDLSQTVAALDFASFLLEEDLRRRESAP